MTMKARYVVLGLSLVFALSLAVPAFGGPENPIATAAASVKSIATKALKAAQAAQTTANTALTTANAAQTAANAAQATANTANATANTDKTAAATAQTAANAAQATANTALSTANGAMHTESNQTGTASSGVADGITVFADCPDGSTPTGGGFEESGAQDNQATVDTSTVYFDDWIVNAQDIDGYTGTTWTIAATVNCAVSP
jgi:membrane protein involved in colicin uptake